MVKGLLDLMSGCGVVLPFSFEQIRPAESRLEVGWPTVRKLTRKGLPEFTGYSCEVWQLPSGSSGIKTHPRLWATTDTSWGTTTARQSR